MGFYTDEIKENWKEFFGKKLDSIPNKYFDKYSTVSTKYDHIMVFRDKEYDYLVVSPYKCKEYTDELLEEGFRLLDKSMYSECCKSYCKLFKNNRNRKVQEIKT